MAQLEYVQRMRVCMDIDGEITKFFNDLQQSPQPNEPYHIYSSNYDIE